MYVITGATGNTGSVAAQTLLKKNAPVRVIGRSAERLRVFSGAEPFVADVTDTAALIRAFAGATAVYLVIPPQLTENDFRAFQRRVTESYATAVQQAGVKHVVALSSFGADKPAGTGPVAGLHELEERLGQLADVNVLSLRAGYFMENTLAQIGIIQAMGVAAGPLRADLKLPLIATRDIGEAAANALLRPDFQGKQTRELLGERDLTMTEVAQILGNAIDRPGLPYFAADDDQVRPALLRAGYSADGAELILELSRALNSGHVRALEPRSAANTTPTSYETWVQQQFMPAFKAKLASA